MLMPGTTCPPTARFASPSGAVVSNPMTGPRSRVDDVLEAYCWCGRRTGRVDRTAVAEGDTFSCGRGCDPTSTPCLAGFDCRWCGDTFPTVDLRERHVRRRHVTCGACDGIFATYADRAAHYTDCGRVMA